jgi:hypothetical protein
MASPNPKPGRSLDPEVAAEKFYCNDSVSTVMPGLKDYVAVKTGGTKEHKKKKD